MRRVDLGNYRKGNSRVFSGRSEGKIVRKKLKLDEIDQTKEKLIIVFPEDTISLNSSFFLGVFGSSIRSLGKDKFKEVYEFECSGFIHSSIEDGIKRATKSSNPLESK